MDLQRFGDQHLFFSMRGLVFLASGLFFNESLGLFGVRHCVNSAVPFFHMDLCRFRDQHCFFNESLGLFGLGPFFSMRVLVFLVSGIL